MDCRRSFVALSLAVNVAVLSLALVRWGGGQEAKEVNRVRAVEVVDERGNVCVRLSASYETGGVLEMFYPQIKSEEESDRRIVGLGSPFRGKTLLMLSSSDGKGHGVSVGIDDRDATVIDAGSRFGRAKIAAGQRAEEDPVIVLEDKHSGRIFVR